MQGDFNKKGEQYEMLAIAGAPSHQNILCKEGSEFMQGLAKHFTDFRNNGGEHSEIAKWIASLDCLQSFLYQANRLKNHSEKLRSQMPPPGQMMAASGSEALTDFESLLYHGRAALDRLTFAIAKQTLRTNCEKFPKLPKILRDHKAKGDYIEQTISVIENGIEQVRGILIDHEGGKTGLRSLLAHSKSTGEATNHVFTIQRDYNNKVMYFDLDMHGKGVINTAHTLNQIIPYVIVNAVSLFSGYGKTLDYDGFQPNWEPRCACLTDYITEDESGIKFTTIRTDYHSVKFININVSESILLNIEDVEI